MKIFAATLASVITGQKYKWEPKTPVEIPDWHNGEYGDMVVQQWQVEDFKKRGYLEDKMNIDMSTPTTAPAGRGLVTWARLWKDYNGELANGKYIVPYAIQDTVPAEHWQQIHDELDDFTLAMGCLEFVYDPDFTYAVGVHITGENSGGSGCWSYVGVCSGCTNGEPNIQPGWQALRLPNWCVAAGGIHHEFLHAVGYMHEQDRPDYADWIVVRDDAGDIDPSAWIDTGHPFEPASNVMYSGFTLLNGRSYNPHPLLTTTDAEQGYDLYCGAKQDTHPMEPRSMCLHGDHVDVLRPVFQHKFCDGFRDCLNGEDEDGRLATCGSGELTERGCCAVINMGFGGATCTASGIVNGKDRYLCENGWGAELRWTSNYGWFHSVDVGGSSYYASGDPTHDGTCLGDFGEFQSGYTGWTNYDLELSCKPGDGPATPMPCADHNCADEYFCQNTADGNSFECICREGNTCGTTTEGPTEPPTEPPTDPPTTPETTAGTTEWSTATSTPVTCGCDPLCEDGYTCADNMCVDVNECADGSHNCYSFENCVNTNGNFRCDPNEDILAGDCEGFNPQWKGRKTTKYIYKGDDSVILSSKFRVKNSPVNPRTDLYQGFVMWTKDVCGNDFLKKMRSGEVGVSIVDSEDIYDLNFVYYKNDGRYSQAGISFELTDVITKDLPWTFKQGVATKNMVSDDVQIVLTGIDKVQFLDAYGMDWCLLTAANALMPAGDYPDHMTMCVVENKKFWKSPGDPNA